MSPAALALLALLQAQAAPSERATDVSGVTVVAPKMLSGVTVEALVPCRLPDDGTPGTPHVVDTWPAQGGVVPPGVLAMRVTFDRPMSRCGFLLVDQGGGPDLVLAPQPARLSADRRSFFFIAQLQPGETHRISFNRHWVEPHFRAVHGGRGAEPYALEFTVSDAPPLATVEQALAADPQAAAILAQPGAMLELWVPRSTRDGPVCGNCLGDFRVVKPGAQPPPPDAGG